MPISDARGDHERHFVVKRRLIRSSVFVRTAKHLVKKQPHSAEDLRATLELFSKDAFHPKLKTHKLKGALQVMI